MAQPFIGEVRLFGGNFAPSGWAFCNGQLMPISENDALFALIGTTYGGDGETTFALPDLRSRVPIHIGSGFVIGQTGGVETVTLTTAQVAAHSHAVFASTAGGTSTNAATNVPGASPTIDLYFEDVATASMNASAVTARGGSQPHENLQPYLCVSYIISLFGIFPSST